MTLLKTIQEEELCESLVAYCQSMFNEKALAGSDMFKLLRIVPNNGKNCRLRSPKGL